MLDKTWSPNEVIKLFRTNKARSTIFRDELNKVIPSAERIERGKSKVRAWKTFDLPFLGKAYGFLQKNEQPIVISVYTAKGGVLKTTFSYNFARILALHGIKVLVIGLDVQCSITDLLNPDLEIQSIDDVSFTPGLYEASKPISDNGIEIQKIIQPTDLPTLQFIPESVNLNLLDQKIRDAKRREFYIEKMILPLKDTYDVILFDNAPNWSFLIQNSLAASDVVISPLGCDVGTYKSVSQNIGIINSYKKEMDLSWNEFIVIPTLLENSKLSTQIEAQYKINYKNFITNTAIRRTVKGQESVLKGASIFEVEPSSPLTNDYYEVVKEIWERINKGR